MNSIKNNVIYTINSSPFFITLVLAFMLSARLSLTRDDLYFLAESSKYSFIEYGMLRYHVWSSRTIIETVLIFAVQNKLLWAFLNACLISLICYSFSKLLDINNTKPKWLISFLSLSFPIVDMYSAGWIATTTNYLWVSSLGLFACTSLVQIAKHRHIKWHMILAYILAALYAGNQEQCSGILTAVFACGLLYCWYRKLPIKLVITQLSLSLASMAYHLTCPGNELRKIQETTQHLPEFEHYSIFHKLKLGLVSTIHYFITYPRRTLCLLLLLLLIGLYTQCKTCKKYLLIVPLLVIICTEFILSFSLGSFISTSNMMFTLITYSLLIIILICIPISIYVITSDLQTTILSTGILGIGLASRVVLGFSPTIALSGDRTFLFMHLSILLVTGIMYCNLSNKLSKRTLQFIHLAFIATAGFSLLEFLMQQPLILF